MCRWWMDVQGDGGLKRWWIDGWMVDEWIHVTSKDKYAFCWVPGQSRLPLTETEWGWS